MKPMTKLKPANHSRIPWTRARAQKCVRGKDGKFQRWIGGQTKVQMEKPVNTYQGAAVHHGKEFAKQHNRKARVGDVVRTQKNDGSYHATARWYCKTAFGWREVGTTAKPTTQQIKIVLKQARKGH